MADDPKITPAGGYTYTPPVAQPKVVATPAAATPQPPATITPGVPVDQAQLSGQVGLTGGSELDELDNAPPPSFAGQLDPLPPEQKITAIYTQMLGRQPSAGELADRMRDWNAMITQWKQSPTGAQNEMIKSVLSSPEFQVKQGRETLHMQYGVPVTIAGAGGSQPFVWGSQTTGDGGAKFYHGGQLPYGPTDYKSGLNFMMEYMCNGTSGNPLMNMMRGFGKDEVSRTGLGSPAFEKLTKLGGELYHLGWGGTDHYGSGGCQRDVNSDQVKQDPSLADLMISEPNPIQSPAQMADYLNQRVQQLDALTAQMDPKLDSPAAFQTVAQMRSMLVAGRTFCGQIAGGASKATIVEAVPGAKAAFYAGGDPSKPLPGNLSDWQKETYDQPLAAYQQSLQDPSSYASHALAYFQG